MTSNVLSEREMAEFISQIEMCGVNALWYKTYEFCPGADFNTRKQVFMDVLFRILESGQAKLQRKDEILTCTIEQQVAAFNQAWPDEHDWDDDFFWESKEGVGGTPSGLVWIAKDGREFWT